MILYWTEFHCNTYPNIASALVSDACDRWEACTAPRWCYHSGTTFGRLWCNPCPFEIPCKRQSCSWPPQWVPYTPRLRFKKRKSNFKIWKYYYYLYYTYSGKTPSTRQIYSLSTCLFRICCSIWRAFFGLRPKSKRPEVSRSRRWIVRRFFRLNSLASIKTTVLCL